MFVVYARIRCFYPHQHFWPQKNKSPVPRQLDMSGAESHGDLAPKKRRAAGNQSSQKRLSVGAMVANPEMVVSGLTIMAIVGWLVGIIIYGQTHMSCKCRAFSIFCFFYVLHPNRQSNSLRLCESKISSDGTFVARLADFHTYHISISLLCESLLFCLAVQLT